MISSHKASLRGTLFSMICLLNTPICKGTTASVIWRFYLYLACGIFSPVWKTQLKFTETVNRRAGTQLSTGQAAFDIVRSNSATCAEATQPRKQGTKHVLLLQTSGIMQCMQESKSQIDLWVLFLLRKGKRGRERERETERETLLCFLCAACCLCILKMRLWTTILRILKQNDQNPIYTLNEWRA